MWAALWGSLAGCALRPAKSSPGGLAAMLSGMQAGEPGWIRATDGFGSRALVQHGTAASIAIAVLPARPRMRHQRSLHPDRRVRTGPRRGEHRGKPVTLGADLCVGMRGQARPDQPVMIGRHPAYPSPSRCHNAADPARSANNIIRPPPPGSRTRQAEPGAATPISAPRAATPPDEPDPGKTAPPGHRHHAAGRQHPGAQRHRHGVRRQARLLRARATPQALDSWTSRHRGHSSPGI
jgi:hypothetical protein